MSVTYLGARAVAGSGTSYTGDDTGKRAEHAISANVDAFRPATTKHTESSTAFTDRAARSAATAGMGNGPAALSWSAENAAFARAQKDLPERVGRQEKWSNRRRHRSLLHMLMEGLHASRQ